jgi:hypothetical protein
MKDIQHDILILVNHTWKFLSSAPKAFTECVMTEKELKMEHLKVSEATVGTFGRKAHCKHQTVHC